MMKKVLRFVLILTVCLMFTIPSSVLAYDIGGLSIHGFISQGYLISNDNNYLAQTEDGSFEFNESAINFSIEPIENLRIGLQLMSRDLGPARSNEIYLDWGYADYHVNDAFGIRVGKVKVPVGLYNQTRDVDFLRTSILLPQGVYDETRRATEEAYQGGSVYGNLVAGIMGNFEYELLLGTANPDLDSPNIDDLFRLVDPLGVRNYGTGNSVEMEWGFAPALRWNTPIDGLRFSITNLMCVLNFEANYDVGGGVSMSMDTELEVTSMPVLSVEYLWNNLKLAAEYRQTNMDSKVSYNGVLAAEDEVKQEAFYGAVSYQFCDWFEMGTYYSVFYADRDDRDGDDMPAGMDFLAWQKDWTVSAKFNLNQSMTLKLETHFIDGAAQMFAHENPQGLEDSCVLYAAKCSFNF